MIEAARLWNERRTREADVAAHRAEVERLGREAEWLRHMASASSVPMTLTPRNVLGVGER